MPLARSIQVIAACNETRNEFSKPINKINWNNLVRVNIDKWNLPCILLSNTRGVIHAQSRSGANANNLKPIKAGNNHLSSHFSHSVSHPLKMALLNARSVCNKTITIRDLITDHNLDMLALTETWINSITEKQISADLTPEGYSIVTKIRPSGRGGGVALIYRSSLVCNPVKSHFISSAFECMEVTLINGSKSVRIVVVYRPPPSPKNGLKPGQFHLEFADYLTHLVGLPSKVIIVGDFNVHWEKASNLETTAFRDIMESAGFTQHVIGPTHIENHTLDLVFCQTDDSVISSVHIGSLISDHNIIFCDLNIKKPPLPKKTLAVRKLKAINHSNINSDIASSELLKAIDTPPEDAHNIYDRTLRNILDKHAPVKSITVSMRPVTYWMNDNILKEKRLRRKCEGTWRRTHLEVHRQIFIEQRRKVNTMIQSAKISHYRDKIIQCGNDQKALFNIITSLTKGTDQSPTSTSDFQAESFNEFFLNKIAKIHDTLSTEPSVYHLPDPPCAVAFSCFSPVTPDEAMKVVAKSPTKSSSLDPWPTWLLKKHLTTLAPVFAMIINQSLLSGKFPHEWKAALVTPLLKKPSLDSTQLSNFRPVSNLPFLSKVVERVVAKQLTTYLCEHQLYPTFQSAYRANHSVETALLRVHNDILQAIDSHQGVILVLLDLSAAFDTVAHHILLNRLKSRFGLSGTVLNWITSYLEGRTQAVLFKGSTSTPKQVHQGVPQGSVLGPVLFSLYTSQICDILYHHGVKFHLYADDTQIYLNFGMKVPSSASKARESIQECVAEIQSWMTANLLKLNGDKTELLVLTTPRLRPTLEISSIQIRDCTIPSSPSVRNLGCMFDHAAKMEEHIKLVCRSCYFHLRNIGAIRSMLTREAAEKLMHAFISSRLDNCNSLLINIPDGLIQKLQRVQNTAARIVLRKSKRDSITTSLKELHWLPVKQRIEFKVACVVYKCIHGSAPKYLCELLNPYIPARNLRSGSQHLLCQPRANTCKYGDRSFSVAAPKLWNTLPDHVRASEKYEYFKRHLKTHLFSLAFPK
jgi:hypothetical protein